MSMHRPFGARAWASAVAALASSATALADGMVAIDQERSVGTLVIVPQCGGQDNDGQSAGGFDPFDATAEAEVICDLAFGIAAADQQSEIGPSLITAAGTAASDAFAVMMNVIHAIAHSSFEVTFSLAEETPFTAQAHLEAESSDAPIIVLSGAIFRLVGPGGSTVFAHEVEPGPDGEPVFADVLESGTLAAGTYTLRAEAASVIDNRVPPARFGDTSFDMIFALSTPCPGDTDFDGVVDVVDLTNVILAWGTANPAADVNDDGIVNVQDMVTVALHWGSCPE